LANDEVTSQETEVVDEFPNAKLLIVQERPWFADMANFKVVGIIPEAKKEVIQGSKSVCLG